MSLTRVRTIWPGDGDEHDLVGILDRQRAHNLARPLGRLHRDDAFAAAGLEAVFAEIRAFADAVFTRHQQRGLRNHHGQTNDGIGCFQGDAADARGGPAHGTHFLLGKSNALALAGDQHHFVMAGGQGWRR